MAVIGPIWNRTVVPPGKKNRLTRSADIAIGRASSTVSRARLTEHAGRERRQDDGHGHEHGRPDQPAEDDGGDAR